MKNLDLDSIDVLSHIIKKMIEYQFSIDSKLYEINPLKVQKILYCCYGIVLAEHGMRLTKEHPKGWTYGPAFPRAYNAHCKNKFDLSKDPIDQDSFPEDIRNDIDDTIKHFGAFKTNTLVNWTHEVNGPWYISTQNGSNLYSDINDDLISHYFRIRVIKK